MTRDIPVSPNVFLQGIIDHWDVDFAHKFVLELAREWGYESFATELATKLFQQAGYEVEVTVGEEDEDEGDGWIPWEGGECPVLYSYVKYKQRCGGIYIEDASLLRWEHSPPGSLYWDYDIVAYKVVD